MTKIQIDRKVHSYFVEVFLQIRFASEVQHPGIHRFQLYAEVLVDLERILLHCYRLAKI